jgi:choline dehydrogenase-like flavoprotein
MTSDIVDVLVIGSGPAGAAVTKRLTDLGAKVLCLEQGDWMNPVDYPTTRPDWEPLSARGPFSVNPNIRKRLQDYPVTFSGQMHTVEMFSSVGGTLQEGMYNGIFHPSDFRARTLDGVAEDWPISFEDLKPYYQMGLRERGVSGVEGDPANPPLGPYPTPQLPIGLTGETMGRAFDKLGWYWWPITNAIPSIDWEGRPGCMLHGMCHSGCFFGIKSTPDVTFWRKALAKGASIQTWAHVCEITLDSKGRANGALYYDKKGNLHHQLARVVVVSCNGVGTPRLLLNSKSTFFPQGLANSSGVVGKNFMSHVWGSFRATFERDKNGITQVPLIVTSQQFYETDAKRGFVRGFSFLVHEADGPMGQATGVLFINQKGDLQHTGVPWGADHHRSMRKTFQHTINMSTHGEDLPEESNRVELDPDVKDHFGMPAARIVYLYGENSLKMQMYAEEVGRQAMEAAGGTNIQYTNRVPSGSHLMGTARMGNDPKSSVVNAWNQAHDVKNLFIVDGSSFVTSGAVNPTATIVALALRTADGIWKRRQEWI